MKKQSLLILFLPLLFIGCNKKSGELTQEDLSPCQQVKYRLIWGMDINNAEWRGEYMNYISTCLDDSATAKKLAVLDADLGNYTFIVYGMLASASIDKFENIYENYPIGFYCPGCDENTYGNIYNEELKKLLKKNENLDFDEIIKEEFESED